MNLFEVIHRMYMYHLHITRNSLYNILCNTANSMVLCSVLYNIVIVICYDSMHTEYEMKTKNFGRKTGNKIINAWPRGHIQLDNLKISCRIEYIWLYIVLYSITYLCYYIRGTKQMKVYIPTYNNEIAGTLDEHIYLNEQKW